MKIEITIDGEEAQFGPALRDFLAQVEGRALLTGRAALAGVRYLGDGDPQKAAITFLRVTRGDSAAEHLEVKDARVVLACIDADRPFPASFLGRDIVAATLEARLWRACDAEKRRAEGGAA